MNDFWKNAIKNRFLSEYCVYQDEYDIEVSECHDGFFPPYSDENGYFNLSLKIRPVKKEKDRTKVIVEGKYHSYIYDKDEGMIIMKLKDRQVSLGSHMYIFGELDFKDEIRLMNKFLEDREKCEDV